MVVNQRQIGVGEDVKFGANSMLAGSVSSRSKWISANENAADTPRKHRVRESHGLVYQ